MSKDRAGDLAVLGGPPAFTEPLHVGRPNIGSRERFLARVNDMLDRAWLTNDGPFVHELEERLARLLGVEHCIAVCNGTVALQLAIRALGLAGEVIVPSFTFVATTHAVEWQGLTPVFADVLPRDYTLDPDQVEAMVTERTTGVIGVHLFGRPCDVAALTDVARRYRLRLLFDAAHALGSSHGGRMIGGFGDCEVFSFHASKLVNSFEGAAIATGDAELARRLRLMRNFGFAGYDNVVSVGTNGKMSEVSAAMALTSLEELDRFIARNRENHERYRRGLGRVPGLTLMPYPEHERSNYQYVVVEVDRQARLSRDQLVAVLHAENILARRYFFPGCHRMEPYRSRFPDAGRHLPETERLSARILVLPTGTAVGGEEIDEVCRVIEVAVREAAALEPALLARGERLSPRP